MTQLGNPCPVRHASIQGLSVIVAPMTDGETYCFDYNAQERYLLHECPPVVLGNPVALEMVPHILEQMRDARIVHLR